MMPLPMMVCTLTDSFVLKTIVPALGRGKARHSTPRAQQLAPEQDYTLQTNTNTQIPENQIVSGMRGEGEAHDVSCTDV